MPYTLSMPINYDATTHVAREWSHKTGICALDIERAIDRVGLGGAKRGITLALAKHLPLSQAVDALTHECDRDLEATWLNKRDCVDLARNTEIQRPFTQSPIPSKHHTELPFD